MVTTRIARGISFIIIKIKGHKLLLVNCNISRLLCYAIPRVTYNLQGVTCSQRILTFNSVLRAANLITHANTMRIIIFLYCHRLIAAPMIIIKYYSLSIYIGHGVFMIGLKYK